MSNYEKKYLKYKEKYLELKKQLSNRKMQNKQHGGISQKFLLTEESVIDLDKGDLFNIIDNNLIKPTTKQKIYRGMNPYQGIDVSLCFEKRENNNYYFKLIEYTTYNYPINYNYVGDIILTPEDLPLQLYYHNQKVDLNKMIIGRPAFDYIQQINNSIVQPTIQSTISNNSANGLQSIILNSEKTSGEQSYRELPSREQSFRKEEVVKINEYQSNNERDDGIDE